MRIAIFSDIHGNVDALRSILNDIKTEQINEIICLGDLIALGPNSKECLDLVMANNVTMLLGNHELYYLKGTNIDDEMSENESKHQKWIKSQLNTEYYNFLNKCSLLLEKEINGKKLLFEHFLLNEDTSDAYPFYDLCIIKNGDVKKTISKLDYDLIFIGHEHKEFIIDTKLYDVGSSGCRKDNVTRYTILDTNNFNIETKLIEYDRKQFVHNLLKKDYPEREIIAKWFFGIEL